MNDTITLQYDSLTNLFDDWNESDDWAPLKEFFWELRSRAKEFGLELTDFEPDETNDIFWVTVEYKDLNDVREWMKSEAPDLEDESIEDFLREAMPD